MATITEKLAALNDADLSRLQARMATLIQQAQQMIQAASKKSATSSSPAASAAASAAASNLTLDELLALIEAAKKVT